MRSGGALERDLGVAREPGCRSDRRRLGMLYRFRQIRDLYAGGAVRQPDQALGDRIASAGENRRSGVDRLGGAEQRMIDQRGSEPSLETRRR